MTNLEVVFDVPEQIAGGLATGSLQRVGGVIVDSHSKQVVAWLRDGAVNHVDDGGDLTSSMLSNFMTTRAGAGLAAARFIPHVLVLNLALTAISFREVVQRLDRLSSEMTRLGEAIAYEFARERNMDFRAALETARDVFEDESPENRKTVAGGAVTALYKARENFLHDFEHVLEQPSSSQTLHMAQHLLICAMYAEATRIRCYVANEQIELAKGRLRESVPEFSNHAKTLVNRLLGQKPAVYLHHAFDTDDVRRFLQVQQWLQADDPLSDADEEIALFDVIDRLRDSFWKPELLHLIEEDYDFASTAGETIGRILNRQRIDGEVSRISDKKLVDLLNHLSSAENVIENLERLQGFELELRSLRLASFSEWSHLIDDEALTEHGLGIIVDRDRLQRLAI